MRPSLYLFKRDIGGTIENPKTEVHFVIINSEAPKRYPLNFVCVLPKHQGIVSGNNTFRRIFGTDSVPLARKLLSDALSKEGDFEIKAEVGKRLKKLTEKTVNSRLYT